MAILSTKTIYAPWSRQSNYAGNSNSLVPLTERVISGSGVVKRPGWRKLPPVQRAAPLDYQKTWSLESRGTRYYSHTESSGGTSLYNVEVGPNGSTFPQNAEIPGCDTEADYRAKVKLFDQLKGEGANLANMLGERKQVAAQVTRSLQTIVYAVRDLKRGNIESAIRRFAGDPVYAVKDRRARERIKGLSYDQNREHYRDKVIPRVARELRAQDIANQWLSLQYGWKPLLSDVYDVVNGLHKREKSRLVVFRCSSKYERSGNSDSSWTFHNGKSYGTRKTTAVAKYMIRAYPDIVLAEPAALGFTNPLTVLWEVTPWSFVVDWFLPVGRYLEQLSATHGWHFYDGCYSSLVKSIEGAQYDQANGYTSGGWTYSTTEHTWGGNQYDRFGRSTLGSFPTPSVPKIKNPLSLGHFANALALGVQLFSGKNVSHGVPR